MLFGVYTAEKKNQAYLYVICSLRVDTRTRSRVRMYVPTRPRTDIYVYSIFFSLFIQILYFIPRHCTFITIIFFLLRIYINDKVRLIQFDEREYISNFG